MSKKQSLRLTAALITRLLLPCAILFSASGCATHSTDQSKMILPCKVVRLKGQARWRLAPGESWQPLKNGQKVTPSTVIETAADSHVDIAFEEPHVATSVRQQNTASALNRTAPKEPLAKSKYPNPKSKDLSQFGGAFLRIWDNSRLKFCQLQRADAHFYEIGRVEMDLQAGHIFGSLKKMPATSRYEVKFPPGVAQIRGTTFDINVDGILKVLDGSIFLTYTNAKGEKASQVILTEQMFDARTGVLSQLPVVDRTGIPYPSGSY